MENIDPKLVAETQKTKKGVGKYLVTFVAGIITGATLLYASLVNGIQFSIPRFEITVDTWEEDYDLSIVDSMAMTR